MRLGLANITNVYNIVFDLPSQEQYEKLLRLLSTSVWKDTMGTRIYDSPLVSEVVVMDLWYEANI